MKLVPCKGYYDGRVVKGSVCIIYFPCLGPKKGRCLGVKIKPLLEEGLDVYYTVYRHNNRTLSEHYS